LRLTDFNPPSTGRSSPSLRTSFQVKPPFHVYVCFRTPRFRLHSSHPFFRIGVRFSRRLSFPYLAQFDDFLRQFATVFGFSLTPDVFFFFLLNPLPFRYSNLLEPCRRGSLIWGLGACGSFFPSAQYFFPSWTKRFSTL